MSIKRLIWPAKVNAALAGMGVNPTSFHHSLRSNIQTFGFEAGLTPQETAIVLVSLAMGFHVPPDFETATSVWRREGKVDSNKPEVIDALTEMGYSIDAPSWQIDAISLADGDLDDQALEDIHPYARTPIVHSCLRDEDLLRFQPRTACE